MTVSAGMSCVKYLLFSFNLLFAITGLIILIVGAKSEIDANPYVDLTDETFYTSGPMILIIVGMIVFIVAFFGCCGAVKENRCMINTFAVFLLLIFIAEISVGIAGYVKQKDLENSIMKTLNKTIGDYKTSDSIRKNFDIIQTDLQCCGIYGPDDWAKNGIAEIPDSCCGSQEITDNKATACTTTSPDFHKQGCYKLILGAMQSLALVLGGVGLGIAAVQLLGVMFACFLARSIDSQYETV